MTTKRTLFGGIFGKPHPNETSDPIAKWLVQVAHLSDLPSGTTKRIELNAADARHADLTHRTRGRLAWEAQRSPAIGLTNVDGHIYAYADACPHQFYSLAESSRDGTRITCDLHGWCYDISTGAPAPPVKIGLTTYRVVIEGNNISIDLRKQVPQNTAPEACTTAFDSIAHAPTFTASNVPTITRPNRSHT